MWRGAAVIVAVLGMVVTAFVTAPVAAASCASDHPAPSPHAFVGTVVDTRKDGYIAAVVTDGGDHVTVMGTGATSWLSRSYSSVDRRYAVGARYEFHPINSSDPYRDNICTATHELAGPRAQPPKPRKGFLPGWLPFDDQTGPIGYALFFAPVVGGALGLLLVARLIRRSWTRRNGRVSR